MKKIFICLFVLLLLIIVFVGCNSLNNDSSTITFNLPDNATKEMEVDGIKYEFKSVFTDSQNKCYTFRVDIQALNRNVQAVKLDIRDVYAIREENGAKYSCLNTHFSYDELECDKKESFYFSCNNLPTDIFANRYHLSFTINKKPFRINLYDDTPYCLEYTYTGERITYVHDGLAVEITKNANLNGLAFDIDVSNLTESTQLIYFTDAKIIKSAFEEYTMNNNLDYNHDAILPLKTRKIIAYNTSIPSGTYYCEFCLVNKLFRIKISI